MLAQEVRQIDAWQHQRIDALAIDAQGEGHVGRH
jgi:hypothetical protein